MRPKPETSIAPQSPICSNFFSATKSFHTQLYLVSMLLRDKVLTCLFYTEPSPILRPKDLILRKRLLKQKRSRLTLFVKY